MKKILFIILSLSFLLSLDYSLEDVNETSETFGDFVGPSYFLDQDKLTITFFAWETWGGWRTVFTQLCELSNNNAWDTEKAVLVGFGNGSGGSGGLNGMVGIQGNNSAWVQDPSPSEIWEEFLGSTSSPRRQVVLLDKDLNKRYQFQYASSGITSAQEVELLNAIDELINELPQLQGDMNQDNILNVLDVIIVVNMAIGNVEIDLTGDMNNDGGINILDVVILANIILTDE